MSHMIRNHLCRRLVRGAPLRLPPPSVPHPTKAPRLPFIIASSRPVHHQPNPIRLNNSYVLGACLLASQIGYFKAIRCFATILPPPPPSSSSSSGSATPPTKPPAEGGEDRAGAGGTSISSMAIVIGEIRSQEKVFRVKVKRSETEAEENLRKLNTAHLEDNVKTEMLRNTSAVPFFGTQPSDTTSDDNRPLFFESTRVPPLLANLNLDAVKRATPRPASTREIIYPRTAEKIQVNFKTPPPVSEPIIPPPPPTGPRFLESTTHRVKTHLISTTSTRTTSEGSTSGLDVKSRVLNLPQKGPQNLTSSPVTPGGRSNLPTDQSQQDLRVKLDTSGATESKMITTILTDQQLRIMPLYSKSGSRKGQGPGSTTKTSGILSPGSSGDPSGDTPVKLSSSDGANEEEDDERQRRSAQQKRWMRLKYTMGALGIMSCVFSGYLIVFIGAPKYDGRGNLIIDRYSDLPVLRQYYSRIRDEFETYNRMIKEPSRDKLLPDVLEPPYYQPPYTLVLEFTDLLVHPEWTYQCGWRFKKRPGVDQFLEALYTRFEVVVYTAQMGLTVFPIMEALDGRNLISYKLVRDATNFIDGDHVKDLDKINRDLSKVVVVDWNPQSVKLHKDNLFQIPRWEGNDDDNTLFDLAAFLIAISEWEVQDVRSVLQYYAQFDNPLAKFKENQMQALQATQP